MLCPCSAVLSLPSLCHNDAHFMPPQGKQCTLRSCMLAVISHDEPVASSLPFCWLGYESATRLRNDAGRWII